MTLKQINYIHDLLLEKEAIASKEKGLVKRAYQKAVDECDESQETLYNLLQKASRSYFEAHDVREEFENIDWKM